MCFLTQVFQKILKTFIKIGELLMNKFKLHEAIVIILQEQPNHTASTQFISDEIYRRKLYLKRDGNKAEAFQMFLRAKNYPHMFELIDRQTIKLLF